MSIIGPLVNPNGFENRFDRLSLSTRVFRHPVIGTAIALLLAAGAYAALHPELFH
jgi:hypothetical protein